jgi:hypothetical protein
VVANAYASSAIDPDATETKPKKPQTKKANTLQTTNSTKAPQDGSSAPKAPVKGRKKSEAAPQKPANAEKASKPAASRGAASKMLKKSMTAINKATNSRARHPLAPKREPKQGKSNAKSLTEVGEPDSFEGKHIDTGAISAKKEMPPKKGVAKADGKAVGMQKIPNNPKADREKPVGAKLEDKMKPVAEKEKTVPVPQNKRKRKAEVSPFMLTPPKKKKVAQTETPKMDTTATKNTTETDRSLQNAEKTQDVSKDTSKMPLEKPPMEETKMEHKIQAITAKAELPALENIQKSPVHSTLQDRRKKQPKRL